MGLVHGVGIYRPGRHPGSHGTKNSFGYKLWQRMIARCYYGGLNEYHPTYKGCTVASTFIEFQKFMDWATVQIGYGNSNWALDKDILVKGNRVYSPDVCVFVPSQINSAVNLAKSRREAKGLPIGVFCDKRYGNYYATITEWHSNRQIRLGTFDTIPDAFAAYKKAKEAKLKVLANHFKDSIDPRVYAALATWEVQVDD